jgi:hypothetical protein
VGEDQVGRRRSDIDADALERKHFEPFDIGNDFIFLDDEIVRMIMIIDIVVHDFASICHYWCPSEIKNPRSLERGLSKSAF